MQMKPSEGKLIGHMLKKVLFRYISACPVEGILQRMLSIGTTLWVSDMFSDITQIEPRIICCCGKVSNGNVGIGNLQATVT